MTARGYFPVPNQLLREGSAAAVLCYARLAATEAIWTQRGSLAPYDVRISERQLARAAGLTRQRVRTALAWLCDHGFVDLVLAGGHGVPPVWHLRQPSTQVRAAVSRSDAMTYDTSTGGDQPKSGQINPSSNPSPNRRKQKGRNGLANGVSGRSTQLPTQFLEDLRPILQIDDVVGQGLRPALAAEPASSSQCEKTRSRLKAQAAQLRT